MMLVRILRFGSSWWARFGRDPLDPYRYTRRAAYFNSAGVHCGNKVRRYWILPGLIRFNAVGDFNPQFPYRSVGKTFECVDLCLGLAHGGNRILFVRRVPASVPDYYLVTVSSEQCGSFDFAASAWKSESVVPIAISSLGNKQEAVLLMNLDGYLTSSLGSWRLTRPVHGHPCDRLELLEEPTVN